MLKELREVIALVHIVAVLPSLVLQVAHRAPVALLSEEKLIKHRPVGLSLFFRQTLQLWVNMWDKTGNCLEMCNEEAEFILVCKQKSRLREEPNQGGRKRQHIDGGIVKPQLDTIRE